MSSDGALPTPGRRTFSTLGWSSAAFLGALLLVAWGYGFSHSGDKLAAVLRVTGRWSFLWFSLATWGVPLAVLWGERFRALATRGRDFGLAFAAAHLVHLGLVARLLATSTTPFPRPELIFFGVGVFWVYLLAFLSLSQKRTAGPSLGVRRVLRRTGVEYLSLAFAYDFTLQVFSGNLKNVIHYLPLAIAAWLGPVLRLAAGYRTSR
jgi:hypothetical protein